MKYRICIWMNIPSHWQSAFFKELMARDDIDLQVRYFGSASTKRIREGWSSDYELKPFEKFVGDKLRPRGLIATLDDAYERIHIISYSFKPSLVRFFCRNSIRWCHWGEMPGYRLEEFLGSQTSLYRPLQPLMLRFKTGQGRRISRKGMGAFAQGILAERAFIEMGIERKKISALYYCPDPLPETDPCADIVTFAGGRKVFLCVGVVCRRKGTDILVKAFARLQTEDWCLVVCGFDYTGGRIARLVGRMGLGDRVLFLGAYPVGRIAEVYAAADVFVLASRFDGWGVALNEAASVGLPLIATNLCGAAHHQIKNGGNGYRIRAGSIGRLKEAMGVYIEDPDMMACHGEFSRELFFREFSPVKNGERLIRALGDWSQNECDRVRERRIIIQQPALPRYRVPFFRGIMDRPDSKIKLLYSTVDESLANTPEVDLDAEYVPMLIKKCRGINFMWHSAQLYGARRDACDILVLSWNVQYLSLVPALLLARYNGIKTILWGHGYSKNETRLRKIVRDWVGRMADALLFYDYSTAKEYIQAGWSEGMIYVVPNSLYQALVQKSRESWLADEERLLAFQNEQRLAGRKNLVFIGRIYAENRLDLLIEALPALRKAHPEIQLLLIGRVNGVAKDLMRLAENLGVTDLIRWLGAIYDENTIAPYMLSSKIFCYPANVGLSIMHAMGYGVPALTSDNIASHNPEIHVLRDDYNGKLFKHLDVEDLVSTISSLLGNPGKLAAMGVAARKSILHSFTIPEMVDGFFKAVDELVPLGRFGATEDVDTRTEIRGVLVSIVVPTYRRLDFLKRAVKSVFEQNHKNWELIISDNESPSGASWEYMQELARQSSRVRVYQNTSGTGLVANLNNAMKHAQGEWIKPLFDDDELMPDCLGSFLTAVAGFPSVVLAGCLALRVRKNKSEQCDKNPTRSDIEIVEQRYAHLAMYLQDYECGGVPSQMFIRRIAIDAGAVMPSPPLITGALDSYWYGEILRHGDRLHLGRPLIREYQGTHDTITSALSEDIPEEELILYRNHIYDYIPAELNAPPPYIIEQMVYGIRGLHKMFVGGKIKSGIKGVLKVRHPKALALVLKWLLRRAFPGRFTPTPRLRYPFSVCIGRKESRTATRTCEGVPVEPAVK